MTDRNLALRILTAAVGLPLLLLAIWAGDPWFTLLALLAGSVAAWELGRLAWSTGAGQVTSVLSAGALILVLQRRIPEWEIAPVLMLVVGMALLWSLYQHLSGGPAHGWLWIVAGSLYVGLPLWYFLALRDLPEGAAWVTVTLGTVFANDTAAYGLGRAFGRHRMAPSISPGKTWEGALGGLLGAILASVALCSLLGLPSGWAAVLLGKGVGVVAQFGDLAESMVKRTAGAKDASELVPGHGGVLDRLDSLVFAVPLVYHYAQWLS